MWLTTHLRRIGFVVLALVLMGFAGLSTWHGVRIAWADANTLAVRWTINQWRDGKGPVYTPELWAQLRDELLAGLQITPDNPQLLEDLGYLHASRAVAMGWPKMDSAEEVTRQSLLAEAIDNYYAATELRPTFPYSWAYIALAKHLKGHQDAEFWVAFDKALRYGSFAEGVQPVLAKLAFAQWTKLAPQRRKGITLMITSSKGKSRQILMRMIEKAGVVIPGA